jgi:hypothetical protein
MVADHDANDPLPDRLSDALARWLTGEDTTLGGLIDLFGPKSFAIVFVVLMSVPALPLPTGGATHIFEILVALGALQLIAGRDEIWIPARWRGVNVGAGGADARFFRAFLAVIRLLERISRPRLAASFDHRASGIAFGLLALTGAVAAFVAPPFTGLDTLPALGVVVLSIGVLLEDVLIAAAGVLLIGAGILLEVVLARVAVSLASGFFSRT